MASSTERFKVGQCGTRVRIPAGVRVLDVGSGHAPHERADVLLDKYPSQDAERSGAGMDVTDRRLVIGDATAMPFDDGAFGYAIASHVAEHVDDPGLFCSELSRVAHAGYVETPGWLGDMLLRESFHLWRVRRRGAVLEFQWVNGEAGLGWFSDLVYAAVYLGEKRPGRRTFAARGHIGRQICRIWRIGIAAVLRLPVLVDAMYTRMEWSDELRCVVHR